ncbi:MAG: sulfatase-like hydrolase/transferase [Bacteroidales bacterium]|nr:sulfatase-like hydrolase/transferase [Bacteroidales bacterium]
MKTRLLILIYYILFWLGFFELSRFVFIVYNHALASELPLNTLLSCFSSGFAHDISLTSYYAEFICILLVISIFTKQTTFLRPVGNWFTGIFVAISSIITVVDAELYRNWGYRTDCSVLQYLETPKEALASTPLLQTILLVALATGIACLFIILHKKIYNYLTAKVTPTSKWVSVIFIALMGTTIIPMRGGLGVAALRTGTVYFSSHSFANHAAINVHWHFLYSFSYAKKEVATIFMEEEECETIYQELLTSKTTKPTSLITSNRPNIILFILESFTAEQIGVLGGQQGITPQLDSIAKSSILFSNCYGNGTKSEMGIVSILSGYPAQPTTAIIKYTSKAEKLPYLSRIFDSLGYNLSLYHGGDLRFANLNSYFRNGRFNKCITINDFDKNQGNTKWGAYDHVVFNRMFQDLQQEKQPFFSVCYTLSSHEPFDVPMRSDFYGENEYSKFLNSVHYTDSCIGDFMQKAKQEPWWNNTIIIFVSDHGARISKDTKIVSSVDKFHIPMIWSGGAIRKDTTITDLVNQCDLPMMLCNQLQIPSEQFYFSKDILRGDKPFVFYAYNNGFGYIRGDQFVSWDNESSKIIEQSTNLQDTTLKQGQAFLQKVTTDFCRK